MDDLISVVVTGLIHNDAQFNMTLSCLNNIAFFSYPYKIQLVFVHNKWKLKDDVEDHIKRIQFHEYVYIANENNETLGKTYNQGIQAAKSDYIFIMNNDNLVHENYLYHAKDIIDNKTLDKSKIGIVIPWMHRTDRNLFESDVKIKATDGVWIYSFIDGAGCFLFKRETYEKIGPFNEDLRLYMDRDYFFRIREKGVKIASSINSFVTHLGCMTLVNPTNVSKYKEIFGWDYYECMSIENEYLLKTYGTTT